MTARRPRPKKQKGRATGPRRFAGALRDIDTQASALGVTGKTLRAQVARGLIPYRKFGGRIVFLADEVTAYLRQLPGVTAEQALANVAARQGEEAAR